MEIREPSGSSIFYAYASGVVGAYAGGVVSLYLPETPVIQTLGAGLGGITMLLAVKAMHYRTGIILLCLGLLIPLYPAYHATFSDPYRTGQVLVVSRDVYMRPGPGLHFEPPLGLVAAGSQVILQGRHWRRVHFERESGSYYDYWRLVTADTGTGWVYGAYLALPAPG